jgi:hypothetical protein
VKTITASFALLHPPTAVWEIFLDEAYLKALYLEELQFKGLTVLELGASSRKLRMIPRLALPAALEKLVGEGFAYEDHATLDRERGVWTWKMVQPADLDPGAKPKKALVTTHGTIRVEPAAGGGCRRTDTVAVEAHVFGLGGLIESTVEKEIRASWTKEIAFLERRLAQRAG